ncbi:MAG: hypothetical protein WKG07_44960 [Hymenobacter sp.]
MADFPQTPPANGRRLIFRTTPTPAAAVKLLSDSLVSTDDFFVEQVHLTAIVFDNTDDVTVWATTFRDDDEHFSTSASPSTPSTPCCAWPATAPRPWPKKCPTP